MKIPLAFKETFGLVIDPLYSELVKVANHFHPGYQYTMQEIFDRLESKYRRSHFTNAQWYHKINKTIDAMIKYELMEYKDGYYHRTKWDYYSTKIPMQK